MNGSLRCTDIRFSYGELDVLKGVAIDAPRGDIVGILGPNGAGKSTLVGVLSGMLAPAAGDVMIGEMRIGDMDAGNRARQIAVVPQDHFVPFPFSVTEMVLMGRAPHLAMFGFESKYDIEIAMEAMRKTDTIHLANRNINSISGGERQRVIIARALAQEAKFLLMDEPTVFIDLKHTADLCRILKSSAGDNDMGVVVVMHDINLAATLCDRIVFLDKGVVAASGTPREVFEVSRLEGIFNTKLRVGLDEATQTPYCFIG